MIDFNKKHEELYLEELKEILVKHYSKDSNIPLDNKTISKVFDIVYKFDLKSKEKLITILDLLNNNLSPDNFNFICKFGFEDFGKESFNSIIVKLFEDDMCKIILDREIKNEKINLTI